MRRRGLLYHNGVMQFLRYNDAKLTAGGIDLFSERERHEGRDTHERSALADAVDVILWYLHLTFVKANRAVPSSTSPGFSLAAEPLLKKPINPNCSV